MDDPIVKLQCLERACQLYGYGMGADPSMASHIIADAQAFYNFVMGRSLNTVDAPFPNAGTFPGSPMRKGSK